MADFSIVAAILGIAGAGFRLSLVLNAVGVKMATADVEIQNIARAISNYAFTLKQLALTLESAKSIATQSAMETAKQIADQSQLIFDDIKEMADLDQHKDEHGNLRSIAINERVKWCFKKQRLQYLLGQLESMKLSLSLMLQVLQFARLVENMREDPSKRLDDQATLQERAEIQNMVVVRHWSFVELRRLYNMAEREDEERRDQQRYDLPPPRFDGIGHTLPDPRLQIEGPKNEDDLNKALVKYSEKPLHDLDESLNRCMYRPNRLLHAPRNDIVDMLLDEWTRVNGTPTKKKRRNHKYRPKYETDSEDSDIDFERSRDIGGRYIGAPPRKSRNVHFERARVESGSEESDHSKPRHRPPRHAILDSDSVSTSTTDSDSESPAPRLPRRYSESGKGRPAMQEVGDRNRRPYTSGGSPRPDARNGTQGSQSARPSIVNHSSSWTSQQVPPGPAGLRPPGPYNVPTGPMRMPSNGPFVGIPQSQPPAAGLIPVSPSTSPNTQRMYYPPPPQGPPPGQYQQPPSHSHHRSSKKRNGMNGKGSGDKHTFKENAKRDVKRGLIGAGALAGIMDIIEGLGAI